MTKTKSMYNFTIYHIPYTIDAVGHMIKRSSRLVGREIWLRMKICLGKLFFRIFFKS